MSFETSSPNMGLILPGVGLTLGPQWATDLNASLTVIDSHDHSPGSGVQITPAGMNISADLAFNANNATLLRSVRFNSNNAVLSGVTDLGCLYENGVDLFYNDGNGTVIRITQSGGVAGTPGSISGLVAPASASYIPISQTFVWQSGANLPANMDAASLILRNLVTNSFGLTLQPPASLGADYSLTLPTLPAAQSFVTLDAFGNFSAPWTVDNSTIKITANKLVAQTSALVDGVSLKSSSNIISIRNLYMEHQFNVNGAYGTLDAPQLGIDGLLFFNFDATISAIWMYNGTAGSSGTTEIDVLLATSGGPFNSILGVTGKITSAAASGVWTDSNSVIGAQTGVTKPGLAGASVNAGQALRIDLLQMMVGASDLTVIIQYVAR